MAKRISITKRYSRGSFTLQIGGRIIGTATRSACTRGSWLVDAIVGGRTASFPMVRGSLLSALRNVRAAAA